MDYTITTLCFGKKYTPIIDHWFRRTTEKCPTANVHIYGLPDSLPFPEDEVLWNGGWNGGWNRGWTRKGEAFWDVLRLENNLALLNELHHPVIHCDLDIIIEKNIAPIVEWGKQLDVDLIFSRETWGDPFPLCSGFYVLYPRSLNFSKKWLDMMKKKQYGTYSDQTTLRSYLMGQPYQIQDKYGYKLITVDDIKICILDMSMITRDPILQENQYANHINVDNVGGTDQFIRFFYEKMEDLPLTCRCGKSHLPASPSTIPCKHTKQN